MDAMMAELKKRQTVNDDDDNNNADGGGTETETEMALGSSPLVADSSLDANTNDSTDKDFPLIKKTESWVEVLSPDGDVYYWNPKSNETRWRKPEKVVTSPPIDVQPDVGSSNSNPTVARLSVSSSNSKQAEAREANSESIPKIEASLEAESEEEEERPSTTSPWQKVDDGRGNMYWWNVQTDETSWTEPADARSARSKSKSAIKSRVEDEFQTQKTEPEPEPEPEPKSKLEPKVPQAAPIPTRAASLSNEQCAGANSTEPASMTAPPAPARSFVPPPLSASAPVSAPPPLPSSPPPGGGFASPRSQPELKMQSSDETRQRTNGSVSSTISSIGRAIKGKVTRSKGRNRGEGSSASGNSLGAPARQKSGRFWHSKSRGNSAASNHMRKKSSSDATGGGRYVGPPSAPSAAMKDAAEKRRSVPSSSSSHNAGDSLKEYVDSLEISAPYQVEHKLQVRFNSKEVRYSGLPDDWQPTALQQFGLPLQACPRMQVEGYEARIPVLLVRLAQRMYALKGEEEEGVFRIAPDADLCKHVKERINNGEVQSAIDSCSDPHTMANLMKQFFRDLRPNILNVLSRTKMMEMSDLTIREQGPAALEREVSMLPEPNRSVFLWLLDTMAYVASRVSVNKMTPKNLAIVVSPNLYCADEGCSPMEALVMSQKCANLVTNFLDWAVSERSEYWRARPGSARF